MSILPQICQILRSAGSAVTHQGRTGTHPTCEFQQVPSNRMNMCPITSDCIGKRARNSTYMVLTGCCFNSYLQQPTQSSGYSSTESLPNPSNEVAKKLPYSYFIEHIPFPSKFKNKNIILEFCLYFRTNRLHQIQEKGWQPKAKSITRLCLEGPGSRCTSLRVRQG